MSQLPLFVFGTLRAGCENHHFLAGRFDHMTPAVLHDYERVAPLMIDRCAGAYVDGELYDLTPARYDETLANCDLLEEIPPGHLAGRDYERRQVQVETADGVRAAWAYVRPA